MSALLRTAAFAVLALCATLRPLSAQTAVPVIQQISNQEMSYSPAYNIEYYGYILFGVSNNPTSITATGVPAGVTFYQTNPISGSGPGFVWMGEASPGGRYGGEIPGGEYNVTVTATNAAGTSSPMSFRWVIHPGVAGYITPDKVNYVVGDTIHLRVTFSAPVVVSGTPYVSLWGSQRADYVSGSGTTTLVFEHVVTAADGYISGFDPNSIVLNGGTITTPGGTTAVLTERGSIGSPNGPRLSIIPPDPVVSDQQINATVGDALLTRIVATNASQFTIVNGTLPPGIALDSATGRVTGTPTQDGTWVTTVQVTNSAGQTATASIKFVVYARGTIQEQTFYATVGVPFTAQIVATNAFKYYIIANIPPLWFHLNDTTGVISGTPTLAGTVDLTISVNYQAGALIHIIVTDPNQPPPPPPPPPAVTIQSQSFNATVGVPLSAQIVATNATKFAITAGNPPAWLALNPSTGALSGTPTSAGTWALTVQINDQASATVQIVVAGAATPPPPPPPPPPPTSTQASQTITFNSPVSAVIIGQPITLGATSSAGLDITYTVISGDATISGNVLTPLSTAPLVVRAASAGNAAYAGAATDVAFGSPQKGAQVITGDTTPRTVRADTPVALSATTSSGLPVTYTVVSGPATIAGNTLTFTGTGTVVVRASQDGNDTMAPADAVTFTYTALPVNRLVNLSSRLRVTADPNRASIAGFVVSGSGPKQILIRAAGPALSAYGIASPLADPELRLFDSTGRQIGTNSGWNNDAQIAAAAKTVGAFAFGPGSTDSALLVSLAPGNYTAQIASANSGVALIEVYDVAAAAAVPTRQLINLSTRAYVDTGDNVLVGGFVVAGADAKRVLVRAVGPGLSAYGVSGALQNPVLKVYDANNQLVAQNDDWGTPRSANGAYVPVIGSEIAAASRTVGAFALGAGSSDAAVVLTLPPGAYTAVVTGANGTTGSALVEVYELP